MAKYYTVYTTNKKRNEDKWSQEYPLATFLFLGHAIKAARFMSDEDYSLAEKETHYIVREMKDNEEKGRIVYEAEEGKTYNG